MQESQEELAVDRPVPVNRDTQDTLRLFALSGVRVSPPRHAEPPGRFLSVTSHGSIMRPAARAGKTGRAIAFKAWFHQGQCGQVNKPDER
jgi:hypothetical protein